MQLLARSMGRWLVLVGLWAALPVPAAPVADRPAGRLASVAWLQQNLTRPDLVILDASPPTRQPGGRIPGAVAAELFSYGPREPARAALQQWLQAAGVDAGRPVVIVDAGGSYQATRLFWDLVHQGVPADDLYILDGGMAKWKASGGAVSQQPAPRPPMGNIQLGPPDASVRVRLPEFLEATTDPRAHVMLEALDPPYFFGGAAFFNRGGHVPHATLMPSDDFFNPDQTFKSAAEIQRMLAYQGIRPEQQVLTYCGGGGAAAVPFFALRYLAGHPRVKMFAESQIGWLQDPRELPVWTYAEPRLVRDTAWVKAWASPMLKSFGLSAVSLVDVRPPEAFQLGHLPMAVNLPALGQATPAPDAAAPRQQLAQAGIPPGHEVVLISEGGVDERSALAFVALEQAGWPKVSIYLDSLERWAEQGLQVERPAARSAAAARPAAAAAAPSDPGARDGAASGLFPPLWVSLGLQPPPEAPPGRWVHVPATRLLDGEGRPRPAAEIWKALEQAGVPRYAALRVAGTTPGEAAIGYVVFRLMGWPDVQLASAAR